ASAGRSRPATSFARGRRGFRLSLVAPTSPAGAPTRACRGDGGSPVPRTHRRRRRIRARLPPPRAAPVATTAGSSGRGGADRGLGVAAEELRGPERATRPRAGDRYLVERGRHAVQASVQRLDLRALQRDQIRGRSQQLLHALELLLESGHLVLGLVALS